MRGRSETKLSCRRELGTRRRSPRRLSSHPHPSLIIIKPIQFPRRGGRARKPGAAGLTHAPSVSLLSARPRDSRRVQKYARLSPARRLAKLLLAGTAKLIAFGSRGVCCRSLRILPSRAPTHNHTRKAHAKTMLKISALTLLFSNAVTDSSFHDPLKVLNATRLRMLSHESAECADSPCRLMGHVTHPCSHIGYVSAQRRSN